jgi:antitoxin (DNA-binding transcriptional repressor) of toxin-antitoxin stability system
MITVTMPKAQQQLPDLLKTAAAGEEVEIVEESGRTFRLTVKAKPAPAVAVNPDWPGYPHPGSAKGLIEMADDFDAPLDELKEYME